ncbi:MAG: hypothetical protein PWP24_356 [Clostridiales bacterium]|nr:hypothetical protein [Clostridiales bacterium]
MKIQVEEIDADKEEEIIIRCHEVTEEVLSLLKELKQRDGKLIGMHGSELYQIVWRDVYYFEAVDNHTFLYTKDRVLETKQKLYELEEACRGSYFFRASKSTIINAAKIECIRPVLSGRFEAHLKNGEKLMVSRQFVPALKKILGM